MRESSNEFNEHAADRFKSRLQGSGNLSNGIQFVQIANTTIQNGVGAFILQCKRLDLHYNLQGASSHGLR